MLRIGPGRETRDPVSSTDCCIQSQFDTIQINRHCEVINTRTLRHNQFTRKYPGYSDSRTRMNFKSIPTLKYSSSQSPGHKKTQHLQKHRISCQSLYHEYPNRLLSSGLYQSDWNFEFL